MAGSWQRRQLTPARPARNSGNWLLLSNGAQSSSFWFCVLLGRVKPRRGGLFIARACPQVVPFVFQRRGGAEVRCTRTKAKAASRWCHRSGAALLKNKKKGQVGRRLL